MIIAIFCWGIFPSVGWYSHAEFSHIFITGFQLQSQSLPTLFLSYSQPIWFDLSLMMAFFSFSRISLHLLNLFCLGIVCYFHAVHHVLSGYFSFLCEVQGQISEPLVGFPKVFVYFSAHKSKICPYSTWNTAERWPMYPHRYFSIVRQPPPHHILAFRPLLFVFLRFCN